MNFDGELGPIEYVAVEFPGGVVGAGGFRELLALVERKAVRVLDLEFVVLADGGVRTVEPALLGTADGLDMSMFAGASSGLLDAEDLAGLGERLTAGSSRRSSSTRSSRCSRFWLAGRAPGRTSWQKGPLTQEADLGSRRHGAKTSTQEAR